MQGVLAPGLDSVLIPSLIRSRLFRSFCRSCSTTALTAWCRSGHRRRPTRCRLRKTRRLLDALLECVVRRRISSLAPVRGAAWMKKKIFSVRLSKSGAVGCRGRAGACRLSYYQTRARNGGGGGWGGWGGGLWVGVGCTGASPGRSTRRGEAGFGLPVPHPAGSQVGISLRLIERWFEGISGRGHRLKDSSLELEHTRALLGVSRIQGSSRTESSSSPPCARASGLHHRDGERDTRPRSPAAFRERRGRQARYRVVRVCFRKLPPDPGL